MATLPLSVLELAPFPEGATSAEALRNSLDLARHADRLGFTRVWFAEHHNMPGIASTSPELLISLAAPLTSRIELGSGGVMLPNHPPLRVAEAFKMLEALFPGRINLGIGRAPGTDTWAALALRRSREALAAHDFPDQLAELMAFGRGEPPANPLLRNVRAYPDDVPLPPVWLLGSSGFSAELAAELGLGFSFAAHFSPEAPEGPMLAYRRRFRPGGATSRPHAILAVSAVCAESREEAERLASSLDLSFVRLQSARPGRLPSPEEALAYPYAPHERELLAAYRANRIVGTPEEVRSGIEALAARTEADEVMVMTLLHDHRARVRSFELVAEAFGLPRAT